MEWSIHDGDCIPHMLNDMEPQSVDMAVFSPPFPSLYAYTSEACDIGNTDTMGAEAEVHLSFFYLRQLSSCSDSTSFLHK